MKNSTSKRLYNWIALSGHYSTLRILTIKPQRTHAVLKQPSATGRSTHDAHQSSIFTNPVLYSALLVLHNAVPTAVDVGHNFGPEDRGTVLEHLANDMASFSRLFIQTVPHSVEITSPLLLHWVYQATSTYSRLILESGTSEPRMSEMLKGGLKFLDQRWKAAGDILSWLR
jgi:hypothetical protein